MSRYYPFTFHVCAGCLRRVSQTNECPEVWEKCPDNRAALHPDPSTQPTEGTQP